MASNLKEAYTKKVQNSIHTINLERTQLFISNLITNNPEHSKYDPFVNGVIISLIQLIDVRRVYSIYLGIKYSE